MAVAGGLEQRQRGVVEVEEPTAEGGGEVRGPGAVLGIVVVVVPAGVVEEGEQLHHPAVRAGGFGQEQAVVAHPGPVGGPVDPRPVEAEVPPQMVDQVL